MVLLSTFHRAEQCARKMLIIFISQVKGDMHLYLRSGKLWLNAMLMSENSGTVCMVQELAYC